MFYTNCPHSLSSNGHQGSSGGACTSVVTEYCQAWPTQKTPFAAEIEFFESKKRETVLRAHLDDYCRFYFEPREEIHNDLVEEYENQACTAFEVFQALFADHDEFSDEDSAIKLLSIARDEGKERVLAKLLAWMNELLSSLDMRDGIVDCKADSVRELADYLAPFTKTVNTLEGESPTPSSWPLAKRFGKFPLCQVEKLALTIPKRWVTVTSFEERARHC